MNISKISFGRVIKVNAPYEAAEQISNIANGYKSNNDELNQRIKNVFYDSKIGCAYPYKADDKTSYIFSGIHAKRFLEAEAQKDFELIYFNRLKKDGHFVDTQIDAVKKSHKSKVDEIIELSKPSTIYVEYEDDNETVKKIDYKL